MSTEKIKVLVMDSDVNDRAKICELLKQCPLPLEVHESSCARAAIDKLQQEKFDCVILDYAIEADTSLALVKPIQQHRIEITAVIIISKLSDKRIAANAIREGAFEYIPKHLLDYEHLISALEAGLHWAKSENILYEEHRRFLELADGLPQLIWTSTAEGECDFLNKRWEDYTGIPAEYQLGKKWLAQVHRDDQPIISAAWSNSLSTKTPLSTSCRMRRHDGEYHLFDVRALPHIDTHGNLTRWLGSSTDISEAENARLVQAYLAAIIENSTDAIISKDLNGIVTSWNRAAEILFGYTAAETLGKKIADLIIPAENMDEEIELVNKVKAGQTIMAFETIRRNKEGERIPISLTFSAVKSTDGSLLGFAKIARNISDKLAAESALLRSEELFRTTFDSAPVGMAMVNMDGIFIEANRALLELIDCGFHQLRKLTQREITHADDHDLEFQALNKLHGKTKNTVKFEKRIFTFYGQEIPVLASVALLYKDNEPDYYLYQYVDLSERKQYESRLIQLAHFDPLTGLANRTKFNVEVDNLLHQAKRNATPFGVLFGDLDHFKQINDSLGHEAGDELLKKIAERLKHVLRHGDTVARLGGDEFVILVSSVRNFEQVAGVANKLIRLVEEPIVVGDSKLHVSMSVGIAIYPYDGEDAATLLRNADSALYDAKAKGRCCFSLYRKELTMLVEHRLKLDVDLRKAIDLQQFELHYQPVISLDTNEVISAEALVRWRHPEKGMIPPDEFIPYAQESGLIMQLGDWILHEACRTAKTWENAGYDMAVAVNISARQFKDDSLLPIIKSALTKAELDRTRLHLEITEQLLLEDTEHNLAQIDALKNHGMKIYLDDFGIGYSSLSYIIRFAPNFLKIDRSFVSKIGAASHHDALVQAIISLHNVLPMEVIAEGVENDDQRDFLKERGCNFAQGYLFSKPLPAEDFMNFLAFSKKKNAIKN